MFLLFSGQAAAQQASVERRLAEAQAEQQYFSAQREAMLKESGLTESDVRRRAMLKVWPNGQEDLIIDGEVVLSTKPSFR